MSQPPIPRPSFLEQAAAAPFLFSEAEMGLEYIEDNDGAMRAGQYTAERLWSTRPEVYVEITRLLADKTISKRQIKRQCKVHHLTVAAIEEREGQTIDTLRLGLGAKAMRLAAYTLENIEEMLATGRFKPGELGFLFAALVDKGQLLTGGATSRPEVSKPEDLAKKLSDYLAGLPSANADGTHSQTGEKIAVGSPVLGLPAPGPAPLPMDSKSVAPLCNRDGVTAFDAAPPSETGGEGVRENTPPPQT